MRTRNLLNYNQSRGEQLFNNASQFLGAQGAEFQKGYGESRASDERMRGSAESGYNNFINTGGFSPRDIASMRARAISPIRATYDAANRNINRHYAMGGTNAGANVLRARMAREQGQGSSDAVTGVESNIAQMMAQNRLSALGGMTNLYGTTPGATSLFSRNVLENANQGLQLNEMENQRMQGLLSTQLGLGQVPGTGERALNSGLNTMKTVRGMFP